MDRQVDAVLRMLGDSPDGITAMDALREVGTFRLAARISDLRGRGYHISSEMVRVGTRRVARYRLEGRTLWSW